MSTAESTEQAGVIYVPRGIRTTYMTVNVWADDRETFDRIAAENDAKITDTPPHMRDGEWHTTPVASWKDGPVYYSCFGPPETLTGEAR